MFKNNSGDDAYAICQMDIELTDSQIRDIVISFIGNDYEEYTEDELITYTDELEEGEVGYIYRDYWIEDYSDMQTASQLLRNLNK